MRWRLYIFVLSATAVFCFMLLTAATDDAHGVRAVPVSAVAEQSRVARRSLLFAAVDSFPESPGTRPAESAFDFDVKPQTIVFHVPDNADPVAARQEREENDRLARGKPNRRNRVKWDENGWYREEVALVTAYCPCARCCGRHSQGITSTGKNAWTRGLAAEPVYLAYGTRVYVPGYGLERIDDTGGAMRRHWRRNGLLHIDVRMTYHFEARQWGKQYLRVRIYED
ncbi:MAG: 3D domain-containing protein [Planctomycetota bacterium]|jgi:3D (Asp-Asp-Asp) domain-containing protein|nr:3D domain-containing protein [Planctomycetota bacterium]